MRSWKFAYWNFQEFSRDRVKGFIDKRRVFRRLLLSPRSRWRGKGGKSSAVTDEPEKVELKIESSLEIRARWLCAKNDLSLKHLDGSNGPCKWIFTVWKIPDDDYFLYVVEIPKCVVLRISLKLWSKNARTRAILIALHFFVPDHVRSREFLEFYSIPRSRARVNFMADEERKRFRLSVQTILLVKCSLE